MRRAVKRRLWINLALTALAGGLVILVVLVVLDPGHEPPPPPTPLTALEPDAVARIAIEQPDRPVVRLQRTERGWRMTEPRRLRAATGKIESLLGILTTESLRQYPAAEVEPAELGLAEPEATLVANDTRLVFGGTDPIEGRRYVRVGDTVHLVGGRHMARIRNEPLYWVDNALLPPDATVTAIALPGLSLTRDDQGLWHAEPEPEGVSADAIVGLVDAWKNASALSVTDAPAQSSQDAERIRITLAGRDEPIVFHLADLKTGFELIRRDLGLSYTMTGPQRGRLLELEAREPAGEKQPPVAGDPPDTDD